MNAYSSLYLERAREALGNMLHYAVYDLDIKSTAFYKMFICSGIANAFGSGDPRYIVGMSGIELAQEVVNSATGRYPDKEPDYTMNRTPEYWAGWAIAYYEWCTCIPFDRIDEAVPITEIIEMYDPLHEADITRFVDAIDQRIYNRNNLSQLARLRAYAGITQKALADRSGVSVRMIEQYEQNRKKLDHASCSTVYSLSKVLGCSMEDLITH